MANKIQFRRGNAADRPTLDVAEPGFDLDTNDLWLGTPAGNVKIYPPAALGSIGLSGSPLAGQIAVFDSPTDATGYADLTWDPVGATLGVDGYISLTHQAASPTGSLGAGQLFVKASDAHLYFMDELGNETDLLAFGGGRLLVEPDPLTVSATDDYTIFARQTLNDPTAEAGTQTMTLIKGDISVISQTGWDFVNLMDLQVDGVSKFLVANTGALTLSSNIFSGGSIFAGSGAARYVGWQSKSSMQSPVDGNITLLNSTFDNFGLLQFGGTTSSFPAIKRAGTALSVVFADDSGSTDLFVRNLFATSLVGVGAGSGSSRLYFQTVGDTYSALHFNSTINQLLLHTGATHGNQLVIGSSLYRDRDFDHGTPAEPTVFIHSSADPDTDNTQWLSLAHNGIEPLINSGSGNIRLTGPNETIAIGSQPVGNTIQGSSAGITIRNQSNNVSLQLSTSSSSIGNTAGRITLGDTNTSTYLYVVANSLLAQTFIGAMAAGGRQLVFGNTDYHLFDFGHETTAHPTMFFHSATNPSVDPTQWGALYHDGVDFNIDTGTGGVRFLAPMVFENSAYISNATNGVLEFGGVGGTFNHALQLDFEGNALGPVIQSRDTLWVVVNDSLSVTGQMNVTANMTIGSSQSYYWTVRTRLSSSADGLLQVSNYLGTVGATLDVTSPNTTVFRDLAGTGAGNAGLLIGGRLIFDADSDSNNYLTASDTATVMLYVSGVLSTFWAAGYQRFPHNNRLELGSTQNYWHVYNSAGVYEFWSTDVDGIGGNGLIFSVTDGGNDIVLGGGLALRNLEKLSFDATSGADTGFYGNEANAEFRIQHNGILWGYWSGGSGLNAADNKQISFGGNGATPDYWHVYNSTGLVYEFRSANVGGALPGIVWSVNDGTDDVSFSGDINLRENSRIYLDSDQTSNEWIDSNTAGIIRFVAGGQVQFTTATTGLVIPDGKRINIGSTGVDYILASSPGVVRIYIGGLWLFDITNTYGFRALNNTRISIGDAGNYWHVYNSTGTAYEFRSADVGGAVPGIVWSVDYGTDDVDFHGGINFNLGERISFPDTTSGPSYWTANTSGINLVVRGTPNIDYGAGYNLVRVPWNLNSNTHLVFGGSGYRYWHVYNSVGAAYEFRSADVGGAVPGIVWSVADGTDDVDFKGIVRTPQLSFPTLTSDSFFSGNGSTSIRLWIRGIRTVDFTQQYTKLFDNVTLQWGDGADYSATYNVIGQRFEFSSANVDGVPTPGVVWSVADGTDDVNFQGSVTLNDGEFLSFDGDFSSDTGFYGHNPNDEFRIQHNGVLWGYWNLYSGLNAAADRWISFGGTGALAQTKYRQRYDTASARFEFWSQDVGGATPGIVWSVADGTDDVSFNGDVLLNLGSSIVFDANAEANDEIRSPGNGTIAVICTSQNVAWFTSSSMKMYDSKQLALGTDLDYWHVYNPTGAAYEFHSANVDGVPNPGIVWSVADGTDDVDFGGHVKLKASGRLVFDSNLGADTYLWGANSAGGAIVVILNGLNWGQWSAFGTPYLRVNDNNRLAFGSGDGTNQDYWQVYNATLGALEFWSRNVDGVPNIGKVWSIDDGTDDIQFTGSLRLSVGQSIVLDADDDSSQSITATTSGNTTYYAGGFHIFNTAGATRLTISSFGLISSFPIKTNDDVALQFGTDTDYWAVYNSAGTAFELWAKDVDSGTIGDQNGKVLWIDDGTDDVQFTGSLFLQTAGQGVQFNNLQAIVNNTGGGVSFLKSGIYENFAWYGFSVPENPLGAGVFRAFDDSRIDFGTASDYRFQYIDAEARFRLQGLNTGAGVGDIFSINDATDDINFEGELHLKSTSRMVFDSDEDSTEYVYSPLAGRVDINAAAFIRFSIGASLKSNFGSTRFFLTDDYALAFGLLENYWQVYNQTGNAFELWSANVDGVPNPGRILSVANGSDIVRLDGGLSLNLGKAITFDADADANNYIYSIGTSDVTVVVGGQTVTRFGTSGSFLYNNWLLATANATLTIGYPAGFTHGVNNTLSRYEFISSNAGGGLPGPIYTVDLAGTTVDFHGSLALNVGQRITFDNDATANDYIGSDADGDLGIYVGGVRVIRGFATLVNIDVQTQFITGARMSGSTSKLSFGAADPYYMTYNTAGRFEWWSDDIDGLGTNGRIMWVDDATNDVKFGGSISVNVNERLTLDADADANNYLFASDSTIFFAVEGVSPCRIDTTGFRIADLYFLRLGTVSNYSIGYASTQFQLITTDSDGIGTDKVLLWVNNSTDVVNIGKLSIASDGTYSNLQVAGGVLRMRGTGGTNNEDLIWDFETNPNEITLSSTTGVTGITSATVAWKAPVSTVYTSSFNVLYVTSYMGNPARSLIEFPAVNIMGFYGSSGNGVSFDLSTANRLRLRSRDTLGSADLALDVGAKLYFDAGSVTTDTYISAPIDNILEVRVAATLVANFGANYLSLKDDIALLFGTGNDQRIQYYAATSRCEWNTSAGIAFYINDASLDVNFGGEVISSVFSSSTASPASTGIVRLAWGDSIYWRNTLDTADVGLTINASNRIECTGGFQAASSWLPSNGRLSWLSLFNIRSLIDGELRLNNYADTSGVTLNVNTADTLRLRNGVATGAAHLGLDGGGRLVFDADGSSNTYLTGSGGTQIDALVNSSQVMRLQVNTVRFFDSVGTYWGGGLDYWAVYNPAGSFQFWTTNGDGLGADALVYSIADGTKTVAFEGDVALGTSQTLYLDDGQDTYISATGTFCDFGISNGRFRFVGAGGVNNQTMTVDMETTANTIAFTTTGTSWSFAGTFVHGGGVRILGSYNLDWGPSTTSINGSTNGNLRLLDGAGTSFDRLQFGGTTSAYPSLKRDGTALRVRLSDDSGPALITSLVEVEINTAGTGTPNALTADETQKIFTNEGATALNAHELPAAAPGITYTFVVQDADGIQVRAAAGDTIRIGANESATNGIISSTTVGEAVILVAINTTQWFAVSVINAANWTVT